VAQASHTRSTIMGNSLKKLFDRMWGTRDMRASDGVVQYIWAGPPPALHNLEVPADSHLSLCNAAVEAA
jgi:hypothetical protein